MGNRLNMLHTLLALSLPVLPQAQAQEPASPCPTRANGVCDETSDGTDGFGGDGTGSCAGGSDRADCALARLANNGVAVSGGLFCETADFFDNTLEDECVVAGCCAWINGTCRSAIPRDDPCEPAAPVGGGDEPVGMVESLRTALREDRQAFVALGAAAVVLCLAAAILCTRRLQSAVDAGAAEPCCSSAPPARALSQPPLARRQLSGHDLHAGVAGVEARPLGRDSTAETPAPDQPQQQPQPEPEPDKLPILPREEKSDARSGAGQITWLPPEPEPEPEVEPDHSPI